MVKLSNYNGHYEQGKFELMPWEFWTDQDKSQVIYNAYKQHILTSQEVKPYLDVSKKHRFGQYLGPVLSGALYFTVLRRTLFSFLHRRSPSVSLLGGVAFVALTSVVWLNVSPYYTRKEAQQQKTLDLIFHKVGISMKTLYDLVPRTRTSTDIDFRTRLLHSKRNGFLSGTIFAEDDFAPPILSHSIVNEYHQKKIFL